MTEITTAAALRATVAVVVIFMTIKFSKAFSRNKRGFPQSPPSPASSSSSSGSRKYDVFLSFRGEDTRKTFVGHLYTALVDRLVSTYKDDQTLPRGDSIGPSILKAIEESQIAIIVFSKNYADSAWCLDELEYIMTCRDERGQTVIPVFYDVDPSQVRNQKGEFGKAFAKLINKKNITKPKIESWKKALVDASNISGWEPKHFAGGYEAKCIKDIVDTILDNLLYLSSVVDENLVGMGTRLQDLKSLLKIGTGGVRMVWIWGIGGGGKTTLASSLYMEISTIFDSCCFLENIKDESCIKTLQEKILKTVLKIEVKVESIDYGKHLIKTRLGRKNVLLLLDDIDDRNQLEALAGSRDWFGDGSRIIITTRDEHLLTTHRVDGVSHVRLLSDEEANRLFKRRAYNEDKLVEDYEMLSQRVVSYAAGLPLAIIVLGSFLYDKNKDKWISTYQRIHSNATLALFCPLLQENDITEAIQYRYKWPSSAGKLVSDAKKLSLLVSNAKKLRLLSVYNLLGERMSAAKVFSFELSDYLLNELPYVEGPDYLSNELLYLFWESYPASLFPESFQPRKLVVLNLRYSLQEELWRDYKESPDRILWLWYSTFE